MSSNGHGHTHGPLGHSTVHDTTAPTPSRGVSPVMYVFLTVSLIVIFWQGSNVIGSSGTYHVWPAADAAKMPLPAYQPGK